MKKINQTFYSHGKLLLTAEYAVLSGAEAIALPIKLGQYLHISASGSNVISWNAFTIDGPWFSCQLQMPGLEIIQSSDAEKARTLKKILKTINYLNPDFLMKKGLNIRTDLEFNNQWGLGSSSTLITNLATWSNVNPFKLNSSVFNGSGFDIACATATGPVLYKKNKPPVPVEINYPFSNNLYFIYSGNKKNTRQEINRYLRETSIKPSEIQQFNAISKEIIKTKTLYEFQNLMIEHEKLISQLVNQPSVKANYFSDFHGEMKSLGAWGGDFYLAASPINEMNIRSYFMNKGLGVVIPWKEWVLTQHIEQS